MIALISFINPAHSINYQFLNGKWLGYCKNITAESLDINKKFSITSKPEIDIMYKDEFITIKAKWNLYEGNEIKHSGLKKQYKEAQESKLIGILDKSNHKSIPNKIIAVNSNKNIMMIFNIISNKKLVSKQFKTGENDALAGKCSYYKQINYSKYE